MSKLDTTSLNQDMIQGISGIVEPCDVIDSNTSTAVKGSDYEIKMDGEYRQFEGGGVRYTKTGKGRFDLIPSHALAFVVHYMENIDKENDIPTCNIGNMLSGIAEGEYERTIVLIACAVYSPSTGGIIPEEYKNYPCMDCDISQYQMWAAFNRMLKDLAIHYEKGAEKYGENNWRKGIPKSSFEDSGFRHFTQFINNETDEPHHISAIWNFMCRLELELTEVDIPNFRTGHICD